MKRILFIIVCLAIAGTQSLKAQPSIAALHHSGRVTLYSGAKLQTAIDKAVAGDTIYLSEGTFPGEIKIGEKICLIGAGEKTFMAGDLYIEDAVNDPIILLDGINILGTIRAYSCATLTISQCKFIGYEYGSDGGNYPSETTIVRSYCTDYLYSGDALTVVNSKIKSMSNPGSGTFSHCNIGTIEGSNTNGHEMIFTNCIINSEKIGIDCFSCLFGPTTTYSFQMNCWKSKTDVLDENLDCVLTNMSGYMGNDGTVVGIMGGDTPYTLKPSAPHVSEHKIEVDAENQKLNVTLTIEN